MKLIATIACAAAFVVSTRAEEPTKNELGSKNGRSSTERELMRAITHSWRYEWDEALRVVHSLYGRDGVDQALILRAETAISAARAANRLDTWEGSDFGSATPWFGGIEWHWTDWKQQQDGSTVGKPRDDLSIEYFDKIIEHSLNRLKRVSDSAARTPSNAEQDGTGQPATRAVDEPEGGDKPQPEAEGRSR